MHNEDPPLGLNKALGNSVDSVIEQSAVALMVYRRYKLLNDMGITP